MLHLVGATSAAWLTTALSAMDRVLVNHAHCEHKAAVSALSFVSRYPDDNKLVVELGRLASDEAGHFARVAALCIDHGLALGHPDKDRYVEGLLQAARKGAVVEGRVDRLLCCALIEARSCERLRLLAEALPALRGRPFVDDAVCALYQDLWREEATHHLLFCDLAVRTLDKAGVVDPTAAMTHRLAELAAVEGQLIESLPIRPAIH